MGSIGTFGDVSTYHTFSISHPLDIVAGPDGNLWFTNSSASIVSRVTTSGVITSFASGTIHAAIGITVGMDSTDYLERRPDGLRL